MKILEMIKHLEVLEKEFGDCEVRLAGVKDDKLIVVDSMAITVAELPDQDGKPLKVCLITKGAFGGKEKSS